MFSPHGWIALALLLATLPAWPAAPAAGAPPALESPPAVFVRGGIALPGLGAAARDFQAGGAALPATPLPRGGWWLARPWVAGEALTLTWTEQGAPHHGRLTAPRRPAAWLWRRLGWPPDGERRRPEVTALAFSPDGALLAVGGLGGQAAVFRVPGGETVWTLRRPGRVIKHLVFSGDGARLFVGEQGPEGRLAAYAMAPPATRPLWVRDTAAELGRPAPAAPDDPYAWVRRPGAYRLLAAGGDVIAAYTHSRAEGGARARLYRLGGADGALRWAYPGEGPAARMITWFAAGGGAARLGLPLQLPLGGQGGARLVVLDGASGTERFSHPVPPVPPYAVTTFWRGVALNPAGNRMAAATQDGRGYLFAERQGGWRLVKAWELVTPLQVGTTTVTATNGTLAATAREALFITGPSYVPLPYRTGEPAPAAYHPRGNTVFAHDWDGTLRWIRRLDNDLQGLALSGDGALLALAQGRAEPQGTGDFNGVTVARLGDGRGELLFRYPLRGRAVYGGIAVSPDGRWIALAEAPRAVRGDARPVGGHGVLLLR